MGRFGHVIWLLSEKRKNNHSIKLRWTSLFILSDGGTAMQMDRCVFRKELHRSISKYRWSIARLGISSCNRRSSAVTVVISHLLEHLHQVSQRLLSSDQSTRLQFLGSFSLIHQPCLLKPFPPAAVIHAPFPTTPWDALAGQDDSWGWICISVCINIINSSSSSRHVWFSPGISEFWASPPQGSTSISVSFLTAPVPGLHPLRRKTVQCSSRFPWWNPRLAPGQILGDAEVKLQLNPHRHVYLESERERELYGTCPLRSVLWTCQWSVSKSFWPRDWGGGGTRDGRAGRCWYWKMGWMRRSAAETVYREECFFRSQRIKEERGVDETQRPSDRCRNYVFELVKTL